MGDVMHTATPGPWQWETRNRQAYLVHPHRGWLVVMDCVRCGMQGGTVRFATWKGDERENMGGIMVPAHELDLANHPDARLIAAAPDLLSACELWDQGFTEGEEFTQEQLLEWMNRNRRAARAAIAKAKGV